MGKLPILTAKELIRVLKKIGFKRIRQKGSHVFFAHEDGRTTIVPVHPGNEKYLNCNDRLVITHFPQVEKAFFLNFSIHKPVELLR